MPISVRSGKQIKPRRVLLYAVDGIGKSTWASMADRPAFIATEEGTNDIDCQRLETRDGSDVCQTYGDVFEMIGQLYNDPHEFGTVVIDTADWLERLIWADVCRLKGVESIADIGYGKGPDFALNQWAEVLAGLDALRARRGMGVILLAHATIAKFDNPQGDNYDRYSPALHAKSCHVVKEWCDEVFFANYKVYTTQADEGFGRKSTKGTGSGERVLYTTERPAHVAKNRLNLPDELPLNWREYGKFLPGTAVHGS